MCFGRFREYIFICVLSCIRQISIPNYKENGCVLHQPVLCKDKHGHSNKPDGYIVKYTNDIPSIPILVSGFKKNAQDYKKAITESVGYFQSIATVSGLHEPLLVMPCTPTQGIFVFVLAHQCYKTRYN